ncbi:hypothetical protein [Tautonia marina]|uniref:hypothetical protein n=1 Tax=Tautonia marina TaxID=2653855 RepID=UPI00126139E5|nr:hypothetical protein [Tautonia marina]
MIDHALNRANDRLTIFAAAAACERMPARAAGDRNVMRRLASCVMPNQFHLVLWPQTDADLSPSMRWLTRTHTQRWHADRRSTGTSHLDLPAGLRTLVPLFNAPHWLHLGSWALARS